MSKNMQSLQQSLLEKANQFQIKRSQILIVFNLQNEFASPEGKLPCNDFGFVNRIKDLVPKFREKAGDIIWVRSEFETDRRVNDGSVGSDQVVLGQYSTEDIPSPVPEEAPVPIPISTVESSSSKKGLKKKKSRHMSNLFKTKKKEEKPPHKEPVNPTPIPKPAPPPPAPGTEELFLTSAHGFERRCGPGTTGVNFIPEIKGIMEPIDTTIVASHYSAVKGTDLINSLRSRLASEVYMCGCVSNLSIYATIADMIGHGFKLQVIEDCLGFRSLQDHDDALKILLDDEKMGLGSITSTVMQEDLDAPPEEKYAQKADVTDIADSMGAMTITSDKGKGKAVVKDASQPSSLPPALKENKIRVRSRATPKPPEDPQKQDPAALNKSFTTASDSTSQKNTLSSDGQDQVLAALNKSTAAPSQNPSKTPLLSSDAQAQVFAALEKLSVKDDEESQSQSQSTTKTKTKSKKLKSKNKTSVVETGPEGSSEFQDAPESNQPASDSSILQKALDAIKQSQTLLEEHSGRAMEEQEKYRQDKGSKEAREPKAKSVHPSHTASADLISAVPDVYSPSNAPGKKPQTDHLAAMKLKNLANLPTLGPGDKIGEGDSSIRYELLPATLRDELNDALPLSDTIFYALYHEVQWQTMYHAAGAVPRKVAVQGAISVIGDKPLYRHPSDQAPPLLPFTKNVDTIRKEAEKIIDHPLNHVLIQLYRDGKDFISEHSDKTLDIMPGSKIVNASFGAQRTMRLRTKKSGIEAEDSTRQTQRIPMPHNSLFVLGLVSNKIWLHGINPDKRPPAERSPVELAYNGMRISLTFRYIGTFLDKEEKLIWGQGAVGRSREEARNVINGDEAETDKMIYAFSKENREGAAFVWREAYGGGFDVLHFRHAADGP
jgi:nicotinamidase-related amidase/alkylated DNA repair dioxygenase AlkB